MKSGRLASKFQEATKTRQCMVELKNDAKVTGGDIRTMLGEWHRHRLHLAQETCYVCCRRGWNEIPTLIGIQVIPPQDSEAGRRVARPSICLDGFGSCYNHSWLVTAPFYPLEWEGLLYANWKYVTYLFYSLEIFLSIRENFGLF